MRSASIGYLRNPRYAPAPPDQPPHPGEVEYADPQPVPKSVIRAAVAARTIDDFHVRDFIAVAPDERRQEAMQGVEIGQRQERVAPERLEPAAGVAGSVAQDRAAHGVGGARLQPFETGVPSSDPLAGDEPDLSAAGFERSHQRRDE